METVELICNPKKHTQLILPFREDKSEHADLARKILNAAACPVAVPNYRLTPNANKDPAYRHPIHTDDLLHFLQFIIGWKDPPCLFDASKLVLLGHSCSAHMISSIVLDSDHWPLLDSPPLRVLSAVKGIITSEGIFDIDDLLKSFPNYRDWFIEPTFGPLESYKKFSVVNLPPRHPSLSVRWLLLHSKGDTLVDIGQTMAMYKYLTKLDSIHVELDTDSLVDEHNDILQADEYVEIIKKFVHPLL